MYKIAIVTSNISRDYDSADLFESGADRAVVSWINPLDLCGFSSNQKNLITIDNLAAQEYDALILRRLNKEGDLDFQFELLQRYEAIGNIVINSTYGLQISESKFLTNFNLSRFGLPVVPMLATQRLSLALDFASSYQEIVAKPAYADLGSGVIRISNKASAKKALIKLINHYGCIVLQPYIKSNKEDLRVFVVGDNVVGAMKRFAAKGDWRTNIFLGGRSKQVQLNQQLRDLAVKAVQIVGLDYAGVDLICENEKYYVLEVNGSPSWQQFQKTTGKNVAWEIISMALRKIRHKYSCRIFTVS
ncbi:MAG: RimK family alpha-L-glutamate ligase [Actinobacteria bacterium]|nr:MAG: RimK family alpha-L-glutamate ligase [Actinomycetota bacterium]